MSVQTITDVRGAGITPEQYLAQERVADEKSEYWQRRLYAMPGARRAHNILTANTTMHFGQQLAARTCEVYASQMRVYVPATGLYTYPDVTVVCGEPQFQDNTFDTLLNPTVIVEVLSESTEAYDRGIKFAHYQSLTTLAEYVLIAQTEMLVEQRVRQADDSWRVLFLRQSDDVLTLASIGCRVTVRELYHKVRFVSQNSDRPGL